LYYFYCLVSEACSRKLSVFSSGLYFTTIKAIESNIMMNQKFNNPKFFMFWHDRLVTQNIVKNPYSLLHPVNCDCQILEFTLDSILYQQLDILNPWRLMFKTRFADYHFNETIFRP